MVSSVSTVISVWVVPGRKEERRRLQHEQRRREEELRARGLF